MDRPNPILVYIDYKSSYAFLAKDLIYELEDQFDDHLEWLPYTLDIPPPAQLIGSGGGKAARRHGSFGPKWSRSICFTV